MLTTRIRDCTSGQVPGAEQGLEQGRVFERGGEMAVAFRLADLGEGITEAEIVEWLVGEGDRIEEHQLLARVETDKALVEVPSPAGGRVGRIRHQVGDTVQVGEILVSILAEGETERDLPEEEAGEDRSTTVVGVLDQPAIELPPQAPPTPPRAAQQREVLATPAVRRLARSLGVALEDVRGTGQDGRITEADVREHAARQQASAGFGAHDEDGYGAVARIALKGIRRTIARRLKTAVTQAALATHMDEIEITELVEHTRAAGNHPGIFAWIVKATALTLKAHPRFNATLDDAHEEVVLRQYVSVGIAVDTADGLMVPVIRNADEKNVDEIAAEVERMAAACRSRKVDVAGLRGGTFSISNIGSLGGLFATPIPNYPEVAIMATGRVTERLVRAGNGEIASAHILPVSLSFDHRVVDGADAARFVNTLRDKLADPAAL